MKIERELDVRKQWEDKIMLEMSRSNNAHSLEDDGTTSGVDELIEPYCDDFANDNFGYYQSV